VSLASRQGNKCPSKNIGPYYRLEGEIYAKKKEKSTFCFKMKERKKDNLYKNSYRKG